MNEPISPAQLAHLTTVVLPAAVPQGCTHALVTTVTSTGVEVLARFVWHTERKEWTLAPVVDFTYTGRLSEGVTLTVAW